MTHKRIKMVHKMRFLVVSYQLPVISYQLRGFVGSYNELDCHKQVITDNYLAQTNSLCYKETQETNGLLCYKDVYLFLGFTIIREG